MKKAFNFLLSRVRLVWWKVRGWQTIVDDAEYQARLATCAECELWDEETDECKRCGCPIFAKTALSSEKCPVGRWNRQKVDRKKP